MKLLTDTIQMKFNVDEAIQFAKQGCLEEWVHLFLKTIGDNAGLSEGLKIQKRYWAGPLLMPLDRLRRCCGPEENMEYYNPSESWEPHIISFCQLLQEGWDYAPLIVQHHEAELIITDGNHRHEAMRRLNYKEYWVILWDSDNPTELDYTFETSNWGGER
ncbi:MAG: hypothetical protein K6T94_12715 [Paenibacillus sp.]|nr:hypothetical protein [Paenibacillus sp.]